MVKFSSLIPIILILVLLTSFFTGCIDVSSDDGSSSNNSNGEEFEFYLLNGGKKKISEYRGKYVLIDLFGVRCPPCQNQMLVLTQIFKDYKDTDLEIISINVWIILGETAELTEQFIYEAKEAKIYLNWTFGLDDPSGTIFNKYVPPDAGVPMLYILDKNGNIYYSNVGYTDYSALTGKLDELLNSGGI